MRLTNRCGAVAQIETEKSREKKARDGKGRNLVDSHIEDDYDVHAGEMDEKQAANKLKENEAVPSNLWRRELANSL